MLVYPIRSLGRIIGDFGKSTVAAKRIEEILVTKDELINYISKKIIFAQLVFKSKVVLKDGNYLIVKRKKSGDE